MLQNQADDFLNEKFKPVHGGNHRDVKNGIKIVAVYCRHDAKSAALNTNFEIKQNTENAI